MANELQMRRERRCLATPPVIRFSSLHFEEPLIATSAWRLLSHHSRTIHPAIINHLPTQNHPLTHRRCLLCCVNLSISLPIVANTFHFLSRGFSKWVGFSECLEGVNGGGGLFSSWEKFFQESVAAIKQMLHWCSGIGQRQEYLTLSIKRINFMGLRPHGLGVAVSRFYLPMSHIKFNLLICPKSF